MSASPDENTPQVLKDDPLLRQVPEIEGYKVLEPCVLYAKIGEGGMGAVYRGRHLNLDIDVAIKCLKNVLAEQSPSFVTRFQREARIAASVHHQNLVQVYDISHKNGVHYLVMEFVRGETARERVTRKKRLRESEAVKVLLGAAAGLAEAHSQKIVHRDIKPDNILISFDGKVKVSDLGLAKALELDGSPSLTMGVMGTPQYMAPEQWDEGGKVGPSADVWALGATFYFLLTGDHAIPGGSMQQIYKRICVDPFPDIRQKLPSISNEVRAILERCIQRDPKSRYADCRELLRDLNKLVVKDSPNIALADPESGTLKVPPLLSPPPAETLGHIKVAIQGEEGATVSVAQRTPSRTATPARVDLAATAAAPATAGPVASTATPPRSSNWAWGLVAVIPLLVLGWWVYSREKGPEVVAGPQGGVVPEVVVPREVETPEAAPSGDETVFQDQEAEVAREDPGSGQLPDAGEEAVIETPPEVTTAVPEPVPEPEPVPTPVLSLTAPPQDARYTRESVLVVAGQIEHAVGGVEIRRSTPSPSTAQAVPDETGHFEASIGLEVEGEHSFTVTTEGTEEQRDFSIVLDRTPPVAALENEIGKTNPKELDLRFQASDDLSGVSAVWVTMRGSRIDAEKAGDPWVLHVSLEEGENFLDVHSSDGAGNENSVSITIPVDSQGPELVSFTPAPEAELVPGTRHFELVFDEALGSLLVNQVPQPLEGDLPSKVGLALEVGAELERFSLTWTATDESGNPRTDTKDWVVKNQPTSLFGWDVDATKGGVSLNGSPSGTFLARRHTDPKTGIAFVLVEGLGLYVAESEVTVVQFKSWPKANAPADGSADDLPVTNVSWRDASAFCKEFGYQLPTRQQWRSACLGGGSGPYCFGGNVKSLSEHAWYAWTSRDWPKDKPKELKGPQPVRQLQPNAFGLHDMHGNVWEWCQDDATDGRKKKLGGYFKSKAEDCTADSENAAINGTKDTGFRPVIAIH